jgi:hypothetical protein
MRLSKTTLTLTLILTTTMASWAMAQTPPTTAPARGRGGAALTGGRGSATGARGFTGSAGTLGGMGGGFGSSIGGQRVDEGPHYVRFESSQPLAFDSLPSVEAETSVVSRISTRQWGFWLVMGFTRPRLREPSRGIRFTFYGETALSPDHYEGIITLDVTGADAERRVQDAIEHLQAITKAPRLPPEQLKERLAAIDAELARVTPLLDTADQFYRHRESLWPTVLEARIKEDELTRRRLEMDLAAKETRAKTLREQIKQIGDEVEKKIDGDPVLAQLKRVFELRKQALATVEQRFRMGVVPPEEPSKAQEQVIDAEIRVQERMEALRQNNRGDELSRLGGELGATMVDIAEMRAKLAYVENQGLQTDISHIDEAKLARLAADRHEFSPSLTYGEEPPPIQRLADQRAQLQAEKIRLLLVKVEPITREQYNQWSEDRYNRQNELNQRRIEQQPGGGNP